MRKRIDPAISTNAPTQREAWIDLEAEAEVEVTSEAPNHPIEAALLPGEGAGWRAGEPGVQTIRIRFDQPRDIRLIHLVFTEGSTARTQEFALRWASSENEAAREIRRQQYNFTPVSSEVEDYVVDLPQARRIELEINPNISDSVATFAQLTELRFR